MSLSEKVTSIKQLVNLICEVLPLIVNLIKEIVITVKTVQTN